MAKNEINQAIESVDKAIKLYGRPKYTAEEVKKTISKCIEIPINDLLEGINQYVETQGKTATYYALLSVANWKTNVLGEKALTADQKKELGTVIPVIKKSDIENFIEMLVRRIPENIAEAESKKEKILVAGAKILTEVKIDLENQKKRIDAFEKSNKMMYKVLTQWGENIDKSISNLAEVVKGNTVFRLAYSPEGVNKSYTENMKKLDQILSTAKGPTKLMGIKIRKGEQEIINEITKNLRAMDKFLTYSEKLAMNGFLGRYLSADLGRKDFVELNKYLKKRSEEIHAALPKKIVIR